MEYDREKEGKDSLLTVKTFSTIHQYSVVLSSMSIAKPLCSFTNMINGSIHMCFPKLQSKFVLYFVIQLFCCYVSHLLLL